MKLKVCTLTEVKPMLSYPFGLTLEVQMDEGQMFDAMLDFLSRNNGKDLNMERAARWEALWNEVQR